MLFLYLVAFLAIILLLFTTKRNRAAFEATTVVESCSMPGHQQDLQSQNQANQAVCYIMNMYAKEYVVDLIARTLSYADFLKYLAKSLDTIVRFHVDLIYKSDFVNLLSPLLVSFSQLTDKAFLRQILDLLNKNLGPKGFIFSLSKSDGTWRMTCEVKGEQPTLRTSAVGGGGSATSVVSPSATHSFVAAVGGGRSAASSASARCFIRMNPIHPFFGIQGNEVPNFLQNLVNSTTLARSIRFWLLTTSFFEDIFMTFTKKCLSEFGILFHGGFFSSLFTNVLQVFGGDLIVRETASEHLSKTGNLILKEFEYFGQIFGIIFFILDQTEETEPILSEDSFRIILNILSNIQKMFDDKSRLQFRSQVVASLLGFYLIQIIDSADHKKRVQDVLQFKTMESIEQACKGDLESNFANSVNPHFFECSETACKINSRTLLVANTHCEAETRAKALGELLEFYETIAIKKQEKRNGLETEFKLRSIMSNLAVGGGCAAEVKPQISEESRCAICMDAEKTHAFQPCGHKCVCEDCAAAKYETCPMCRADVTGTLKIFDC